MSMNIAKYADQVEVSALNNSYAIVGDGLDDEIISGNIEDLANYERSLGDDEDWSTVAAFSDIHEGKIRLELEKRSELLGSMYPFELVQSSLTYSQATEGVMTYESLLLLSLTTRRQGKSWLELTNSFERLSAMAVKNFFQCDKCWWTGANSDQGFEEIVRAIHGSTGELEWNPDPTIHREGKRIKDASVDFINYRRLDSRPGGLFFFGQSACGKDWYSKTERDLRLKKIERIFRLPYATPVCLFVIPYLDTGDLTMMARAASNFSGLIFDRARLTKVLADMKDDAKVEHEIRTVHHLASTQCN